MKTVTDKRLTDMNTDMESMLEILIRQRRFELWNKIQELYTIPEEVKTQIHRWIMCNCNYQPKIITKVPIETSVPPEDT